MKKIAKPSTYSSKSTGRPGIFGVNVPVATTLRVAGGSPGYDPFTRSIAKGRSLSMTHQPHSPVPKKVYVGHGGGKAGASSR